MKLLLSLLIILFFLPAAGQNVKDSVDHYLSRAKNVVYEDFSKAVPILEKAESFADKSQDPDLLAEVAHQFAVAYYVKGEYNISLDYFLKAAEYYRKAGNELGKAKCLVGEGLIQQGIDRHAEAIRLFELAIKAYAASGNFSMANPAFLNIAISEIETGKLGSAKKHLQKALELSKEAGRVGVEHLALNKMGEVAFLEGKFALAVDYHNRVLTHQQEPNGWEKSFAYAGLAQAHNALGDTEKALSLGEKAMDFANKSGSLWDLERNSGILYRIYKSAANTSLALHFLELHKTYRDSLYNQKKLREINSLQLENKEAENFRLLLEQERTESELLLNRGIMATLIGLAIFLLILLFVYRRNVRQKNRFNEELKQKNETILKQNELIVRRNEELDELNKTKDRLFSILSHDLRSPIGSIEQILKMIKEGEFSDEEKVDLLDEMLVQVSETSQMLYNLLHWANSQMDGDQVNFEDISLPNKIKKVLGAHYFAINNKGIKLTHNVPQNLPQIIADRGQLSIILHNLLSNAIKYTHEGKEIRITYLERAEKVFLKIKDGGEGIAPEKIKEIMSFDTRLSSEVGTHMEMGTGLGLLLVKQFLQLNKAEMNINSYPGEGAEFTISFLKSTKANN